MTTLHISKELTKAVSHLFGVFTHTEWISFYSTEDKQFLFLDDKKKRLNLNDDEVDSEIIENAKKSIDGVGVLTFYSEERMNIRLRKKLCQVQTQNLY